MPDPWVSVDDVARHLGVAKDTVYRWIERRGLPAHTGGARSDDADRAGGS